MNFKTVRIIFIFLCMFVLCQVFPVMITTSTAGSKAIERLVDILEKRGDISNREANFVRKAIAKEEDAFLRKKRELEVKERKLLEQERVLTQRETAVSRKEKISGIKEVTAETDLATSSPIFGKKIHMGEQKKPQFSPLETRYEDGFCITTPEKEIYSLCIGGLLQTDYRYFKYENEDPDKNRFDMRRVRLSFKGKIHHNFGYKFEYEFQGAGSRNLMYAYLDASIFSFASIRIGQFKEPFGLEYSTGFENIFFAERSMGYYLIPHNDVGLMIHGSLWNDRINYGLGIFNGDGPDDSVGGDQDAPQFTGRVVFAPFRNMGTPFGDNFQVGGSYDYAKIDRNNVDIHVKTAGLTSFFDVASRAKFKIIRNADKRCRRGIEYAWAYGPVGVTGEYINVLYPTVETSAGSFEIEIKEYYISLLLMLTGENPVFKKGIFQPIEPKKDFLKGDGWGAFGIGFRYDLFSADESVYDNLIQKGDSVREAKATSYSINWFLNPSISMIFDATITDFDSPLLVGRDSLLGTAMYSDREKVFTGRCQLKF